MRYQFADEFHGSPLMMNSNDSTPAERPSSLSEPVSLCHSPSSDGSSYFNTTSKPQPSLSLSLNIYIYIYIYIYFYQTVKIDSLEVQVKNFRRVTTKRSLGRRKADSVSHTGLRNMVRIFSTQA